MNDQLKAVVSVAEMARMVGLSRARFYQLMGTTFPPPLYDLRTRRPIYVQQMQEVCLEVRRRNCGINGKPVLFYARGHRPSNQGKSNRKLKPLSKPEEFSEILDAVKGLGLHPTTAQVSSAVRILFPQGVKGVDQADVVRAVFIHLKRQNPGGNVGR